MATSDEPIRESSMTDLWNVWFTELHRRRVGLTIKDMDVIEINEAFAVQVLSCLKGLGVAFDDSRVNPNGGAIAIGHPLGASGARLALTAARQLQRSGGRYDRKRCGWPPWRWGLVSAMSGTRQHGTSKQPVRCWGNSTLTRHRIL